MAHTSKDKKQLLTRVRRIKGQASAIESSLDKGADCSSVLQQIAAIRGAVNGLMFQAIFVSTSGRLTFPPSKGNKM